MMLGPPTRRWLLLAVLLIRVAPSVFAARTQRRLLSQGRSSSFATQQVIARNRLVYKPFDIDPDTFMDTVRQISTDVLILFYSPTCSDCTKMMPQWVQLAVAGKNRSNLTFLTVADPMGLAPDNYTHDENPAIFFAPRDRKTEPVAMSMDDIHAFTYTNETADTEAAVRAAIMSLVDGNAFGNSTQPRSALRSEPLLPAANRSSAPGAGESGQTNGEEDEWLTARLLAALREKRQAPVETQLKVAKSPVFAALPVARFLSGLTAGQVKEPLFAVAAHFLDVQRMTGPRVAK